jgi:predicted GIY-YIG superfamily endonuclease
MQGRRPARGKRSASGRHVETRAQRFVYVIRSVGDPDRHYVGLTSDVASRLVAHNTGRSPHTAKHVPWRLVVCLGFASDTGAAEFEKYLKSTEGRTLIQDHFW